MSSEAYPGHLDSKKRTARRASPLRAIGSFGNQPLHAVVVGAFPVDAAARRAGKELGVEVARALGEAGGDGFLLYGGQWRVAAQASGEARDGVVKIEALDYFGELEARARVTHPVAMRDGGTFEQADVARQQNAMLVA